MAHVMACGFVMISKYDSLHTETWLIRNNMVNSPNDEIYITSLYWAFSTMITVGYGDIAPISVKEKIFVIIAMLVACGMFGYSVGSIQSVTAKRAKIANEFHHKQLTLKRYMKSHKIPNRL
jgi:hypothetical protein